MKRRKRFGCLLFARRNVLAEVRLEEVPVELSAANPAQSTTGWGGPYTTPAEGGLSYTTVPEPGTVCLAGIALVGVGCFRRRK